MEWDLFPFYIKIVSWWPEQKTETSNHCKLLMALLDRICPKYKFWNWPIRGYVHIKNYIYTRIYVQLGELENQPYF